MEKVEQLELFSTNGEKFTENTPFNEERNDNNGKWLVKIVSYDDFLNDDAILKIKSKMDTDNPNSKHVFDNELARFAKKYSGFKPDRIRMVRNAHTPEFSHYTLLSFYAKYKYVKSDYLLERLDGMTVNKIQRRFNTMLYDGNDSYDNVSYQKSIKAMAHGVLKYFKASDFKNVSLRKFSLNQLLLEYKGMRVRIEDNKDNTFNVLIYKGQFDDLETVSEFGLPRKEAFEILHDELKQLEPKSEKEGDHPMKDIDDELNNAHKAYLFARKIDSKIDFDGVKEKDIETLLDTVQRIQNVGAMVEYQIEDYKESRGE